MPHFKEEYDPSGRSSDDMDRTVANALESRMDNCGQDGLLVELLIRGQELAGAHRAHAEAFLRFKLGKKPPTDNVAKAQADIEVDVFMPATRYLAAQIVAERDE